ncbi:uncharacterized protein [Littorina saxatilis]|uniref:Uncharacterized protein n=1 Tax=Littorina saxatilis TaxID=31220 RepID=A0AAN9GB58_9CAEN
MTSQRASTSPSANIVWDKSRLPHHERATHNGQALVPARNRPSSTGPVARRVNHQPHHHHNNNKVAVQNGRTVYKASESELNMSFDPMKDLHMWTMWRVAVNGRIVEETRKNKNRPHTAAASTAASTANRHADLDSNPFGRALVKTPLHRFIRVENGSNDIAGLMMDPHGEGGRSLGTQQFVFYGVPRVVLKKPKQQTIRLP